MISGVYIADTQGEIIVERTYIAPPPRDSVKKLIMTQLNQGEGEKTRCIDDEIVWEVDQHFLFAIRRGQVIILATSESDVLISFSLTHLVFRPSCPRFTRSFIRWRRCWRPRWWSSR